MTSRHIEVGDFSEEQLRVQRAGEALHRDGASPAGALELLAALVEDRTWERLTDAKGRSFKGRFRVFVETRPPFGLGYDPDQLPKLLALRHPHESVPEVAERMQSMRQHVTALLRSEIPAALPWERPTTESNKVGGINNTTVRDRANTIDHITARLKRDDPDLAEKVVRGEVSPNAAAREKGWRKPRIILSSPERVANSIRKHMPPEDVAVLAQLLANGVSVDGMGTKSNKDAYGQLFMHGERQPDRITHPCRSCGREDGLHDEDCEVQRALRSQETQAERQRPVTYPDDNKPAEKELNEQADEEVGAGINHGNLIQLEKGLEKEKDAQDLAAETPPVPQPPSAAQWPLPGEELRSPKSSLSDWYQTH